MGARAIVFLLAFWLALPITGTDEELTPEEMVARHLDSVGTPEAQASLKSRILKGQGFLRILLGGSGGLQGTVTHTSEGNKSSFRFTVDNPTYRGEQMLFDGKQPWVYTGIGRSDMGVFINTHNQILREGLLSGTLSTAWALLHLDASKPKLRYRGVKKVNDRKLHRIDYQPKKRRGDLRIELYFEPETFRHVLTTYHFTQPAQIGVTDEESARQQPIHYRLEESFENFQQLRGLTLPATWKIRFSRTRGPSLLWEWEMFFQSGTHNPPVDPESFRPQ